MGPSTIGFLLFGLAAFGIVGGGINLYQARTGVEVIKTGRDTPETLRRNSLIVGLTLVLSALAEVAIGIYLLS